MLSEEKTALVDAYHNLDFAKFELQLAEAGYYINGDKTTEEYRLRVASK